MAQAKLHGQKVAFGTMTKVIRKPLAVVGRASSWQAPPPAMLLSWARAITGVAAAAANKDRLPAPSFHRLHVLLKLV